MGNRKTKNAFIIERILHTKDPKIQFGICNGKQQIRINDGNNNILIDACKKIDELHYNFENNIKLIIYNPKKPSFYLQTNNNTFNKEIDSIIIKNYKAFDMKPNTNELDFIFYYLKNKEE